MPCITGPSGPLTSTVWLIRVFPADPGSTRQLNLNRVNGTTGVSRAKNRPG